MVNSLLTIVYLVRTSALVDKLPLLFSMLDPSCSQIRFSPEVGIYKRKKTRSRPRKKGIFKKYDNGQEKNGIYTLSIKKIRFMKKKGNDQEKRRKDMANANYN